MEQILGRLAYRSHGIVTRAQLLGAGVTRAEIDQRLRTKALLPVHRGVYRVGHRAPNVHATYLAAVHACGKRALLSGRAAAHLLGILKGPAPPPEVTAATERCVRGLKTRKSPGICEKDGTTWRGIPVTTVARTLVDLAAQLEVDELARACHEAGVRHGTTPAHVEAVLGRRPNTPGASKLRKILRGEIRVVLSKLEAGFQDRLREADLPLPQTNCPAGGRRVDCRWPEHHLTVELDSYTYHHSRHAWEQDRAREREAHARQDQLRRYTWSDVFENPGPMLAELRALLGSDSSPQYA